MNNTIIKNSIKALIDLEPDLVQDFTIKDYIDLIFLKNV